MIQTSNLTIHGLVNTKLLGQVKLSKIIKGSNIEFIGDICLRLENLLIKGRIYLPLLQMNSRGFRIANMIVCFSIELAKVLQPKHEPFSRLELGAFEAIKVVQWSGIELVHDEPAKTDQFSNMLVSAALEISSKTIRTRIESESRDFLKDFKFII
ncbi:hypothetical protein Ciccas_003785 [Cichlidogyrus casuarinus]|uniref:Uncharacterized protein n=1 Tax=Cichlidogyrus casuarinus TaxID=1844966 RepID=A0ABD2QDJ9_9PLAT